MSKEIIDEQGNSLIIAPHPPNAKVFLRLKDKDYKSKRLIGIIDYSARKLIVKRNREKHLFRKNQSYGFNFHFLSNATRFDVILVYDNYGKYKVKVKDVLEMGTFLYFKEHNLEKQIFYPVEFMTEF